MRQIRILLTLVFFCGLILSVASAQAPPEQTAPPAAAQPPGQEEEIKEGYVSVDFKDADIRDVLRILSRKSGVDIIASDNVQATVTVKLSNVPWEWGEFGVGVRVERALPDPGVTTSCDTEAELDSAAISPQELDGLLLPGGLGTWMIRGHPGLQALIRDVHAAGKPIGAIERGPKLLAGAGVLDRREITCAPQMRDDIIHAVADIRYRDEPVVHNGNLLTCQGTENLPAFMRTLLNAYGRS